MRLLLDQNLSRSLLSQIEQLFPGSSHVADEGLQTASDQEIWRYAASHVFSIFTKDSDFQQMSFMLGAPPKVIWVALGNCPTQRVIEAIWQHIAALRRFADDPDATYFVLGL